MREADFTLVLAGLPHIQRNLLSLLTDSDVVSELRRNGCRNLTIDLAPDWPEYREWLGEAIGYHMPMFVVVSPSWKSYADLWTCEETILQQSKARAGEWTKDDLLLVVRTLMDQHWKSAEYHNADTHNV